MNTRLAGALLAGTAVALAVAPAQAQSGGKDTVRIVGHVLEPAKLEPTDERIAEGLVNPCVLYRLTYDGSMQPDTGVGREDPLDAMKGQVLADGSLKGTYAKPEG